MKATKRIQGSDHDMIQSKMIYLDEGYMIRYIMKYVKVWDSMNFYVIQVNKNGSNDKDREIWQRYNDDILHIILKITFEWGL